MLKKIKTPNRTAKNVKELKDIANKGMSQIQNSTELIKSFFTNDKLHLTTNWCRYQN